MNDLMNALYEYLADHTSIWNDLQYQASNRCASAKQKQLDSQLNDQQRQLLDDLLIELQIAHSLELKHTFQKTLSLSRELSSLVRG